jgi:voltage-gated potassium channel
VKRNRAEIESVYTKWTQYPLLFLAFSYLVIYAWPIINPETPAEFAAGLEIANAAIWAIFIVDVLVRAVLAKSAKSFLRQNWLDVIAIAIPFLRPLRGLRILSVGVIAARRLSGALQYRIAIYGVGVTLLIVFIAGLAVTEAERGVESANIHDVFQGWWWAFITLSTVGYGDKYPVSPEGQWIAVGVVIAGIGLLGTVSATIASLLLRRGDENARVILKEEVDQTKQIQELAEEIRGLRAELARVLEKDSK